MNTFAWLTDEQTLEAALTIALQVTLVLGVTCGVAWMIRRNAVARHAVCLAGLVLALACPLLVWQSPSFGWSWLRVDWPALATGSVENEIDPIVADVRTLPTDWEPAVTSAATELELPVDDHSPAPMESITVPPDVVYRPGDSETADHSTAETSPAEVITLPDEPLPAASAPVMELTETAVTDDADARVAIDVRAAVGVALIMWALGVIVQLARWIIARHRLRRLFHGARTSTDCGFAEAIAGAAAAVGLRQAPMVLSGPLVPIPLVHGVLRPRVLLPQQFLDQAQPADLRDVLIHEFAHIVRRDPWIALLQRLAAVLYWPHPLLHLLNRQLSGAREEVCDNYVLREGRNSTFAEVLLSLSEQVQPAGVPLGLLGLVARHGRLETRIRGLLDPARRAETRASGRLLALMASGAMALLVGVAGIRAGTAVDPADETPATEAETSGSDRTAVDNSGDETADARVIRGVVEDEQGNAVVGARVRFGGAAYRDHEATTGEGGRFELPLPMGRPRRLWPLLAESQASEQMGFVEVEDPGRGDLTAHVMIRPARAVSVHVRDELGTPIPGAEVIAIGTGEEFLGSIGESVTGPSGDAVVHYPDGVGVAWVLARCDGIGFDYYENGSIRATPLHLGPLPQEVELTLDGAQSATVRVVDSSGAAVGNARVYPWYIHKPGKLEDVNLSGALSFPVDANGSVHFAWLPEQFLNGIPFIAWSTDAHAPKGPALLPDSQERHLTIEVLRHARLRGQVLHHDGRPAPGIRVIAVGAARSPLESSGHAYSTSSDDEGRYEIEVNSNAAYMVSVENDEWAAAAQSSDVLGEDKVVELDLTLTPGTVVTGQVTVGDDRTPSAGEFVILRQSGQRLPKTEEGISRRGLYHRTHTDDEGRYSFRVGPGEYYLIVRQTSVTGREPLWIKGDGERLFFDQHFEAPQWLPLHGQIVNGANGSPIEHANVFLGSVADDGASARMTPTRMIAGSDADGRFRVDRRTAKNLIYAHSADGSLAGFTIVDHRTAEITLELHPSVTVVGQLLDHNREPLADVEVAGYVRSPEVHSSSAAIRTRTDEQGNYRITGVAVGAHFTFVPMRTHFHDRSANPTRIFDQPGEVTLEPVVLPRIVDDDDGEVATTTGADQIGRGQVNVADGGRGNAKVVSVRVRDGDGAPVPDARVIVVGRGVDLAGNIGDGVTGPTGNVDVEYPDGEDVAWVVAWCDGVGFDYFENYSSTAILHPGSLPAEVDLVLDGARTVDVHVVDSSGAGVGEANVYPWSIQKPGKLDYINLSGTISFPVNADGHARFAWLPRKFVNSIAFIARTPDTHAPEYPLLEADSDERQVTVKLLRNAQIAGRVLHDDGRPAVGIRVVTRGASYGQRSGRERWAYTDEEGRYELPVESNAAYLVSVHDDEWAAAAQSTDVLGEGEVLEDLDLTLSAGTVVTGQITVGESRTPVSAEHVVLTQLGDRLPRILGQPLAQRLLIYRTQTDATGRYAFRVGPGEYRLMIRGQRPHGREPLQIAGDTDPFVFNQHFETPKWLTLSGRIVNASDGSSLSEAKVYVGAIGDDEWPTRILATTDEDGRFRVDRFKPENLVYAHSADGSLAGFTTVDRETDDVSLELEPAVTVAGQLLDNNGQPFTDVEVAGYVSKPGFNSECAGLETRTDEQGRFRIAGVAVGARFKLVPMRKHFPGTTPNSVRIFDQPGEVTLDPVVLPRMADDDDGEVAATTDADDASPRPQSLIEKLTTHCNPWINTPGEHLRALQYTYTLGNDRRRVELVRGVSQVRQSEWIGSTLSTGLHWLLRRPDQFEVEVAILESELNRLQFTVRPKAELDSPRIFLEVGNGISGSWRGYFSHPSDEMTLVVDGDRMLPLRETHKLGDAQQTTVINYGEWEKAAADAWIPKLVTVEHGGAVYRMHFAWQAGAAWLLTHAETEYEGKTNRVAEVTNVVVNDAELIRRTIEEREQRDAAAGVVQAMLDQNRPWLAGEGLSGLESLSYEFHMVRDDMIEQCVVTDDGTTVMEVIHHDRKNLSEREGQRQFALTSGEWGQSQRGGRFALIDGPSDQERGRPFGEQLRHYGQIGCQLDLPIFRYGSLLTGAKVEIEEGEWNGTPCHVARVRSLGRDVYLGCGTMLGSYSTSYVHHIWPAYETIYIDRERNVPLHETLVSSSDNKRFEIDFTDYQEIESGQWAPMAIRVESPEYFTCELKFQLIEDRHWLLAEVESWFDPETKNRGVVQNVVVNQPSQLWDETLKQIDETRFVFGDPPAPAPTVEVPAHEFRLGHRRTIGALDVLFTLNPAGELVVRCTPAQGQTVATGEAVSVLLLDEDDRMLSAAQATFVEQDGRFEASASFGRSHGLADVVRYVVAKNGDFLDDSTSDRRTLAAALVRGQENPPANLQGGDKSGNTRATGVAIRPGEAGEMAAFVSLASQDRMNEFGLDVSVAVFTRRGELITAGAKQGTLLVKSSIAEETWEVLLPGLESVADFDRVVVGINRGQTYSAPAGTLWARFLTTYPIFDVETMLAAEDPGCWQVGLQELEERIRDDVLDRGLLDGVRDWKEQVAEHQTHQDVLRPRVERLLAIANQADEPEVLATALRLLGLSGDQRAAATIRSQLNSDDAGLRDVAAIALGMLGEADGLPGIDAFLYREAPTFESDPAGYRSHRARSDDALIALVTIRTDESVALIRRLLTESLGQIEQVPHESGGYSWRGTHHPDRLAKLMGCVTDARYVGVLSEAITLIESQRPANGEYGVDEFITSLHEYGEAAREFIAERVRAGDFSALPSRDPYYVAAMRDSMLSESADAGTIYEGVRYLWNVGTEDAIALLRDTFDQRLPEDRRVRLYVCEALAYHGDDRGLPIAFGELVAACVPEDPPADADARRTWQRARDNAQEDPLDVFERAQTASRIAFVTQHLQTDDPATQIACLKVLDTLRGAMPETVRGTLQGWQDSANQDVATEAALLLQRE